MSAAGPVANFTLALIAAVIMRLGLAIGIFEPSPAFFTHMVGAAQPGGVMDGVAAAVSILFSLNILLGVFNLLPIPPLDGYGVLGLFVSPGGAIKLQQLRFQMRTFAIIGLVLAWQLFDHIFPPVFAAAGRMLYYGYRFS
jgi:Zn-dependent protease